jgi:hypothetical protein
MPVFAQSGAAVNIPSLTENHGVPGSNPGPATPELPAKVHKNNDDEGYFIYTPLTTEMDFGCYTGYGMGNPDGYPRIRVGLYVDPEAPGAEAAIAAIKQVSLLEGWEDNLDNRADWPEVWRETSLVSLLPEEDHVATVKHFFIESMSQLKETLTTFKKEHPGLPWEGRA